MNRTLFEKLIAIWELPSCELGSDNERQFIKDCKMNLAGLDGICDEDLADYLTERQRKWIADIYERTC